MLLVDHDSSRARGLIVSRAGEYLAPWLSGAFLLTGPIYQAHGSPISFQAFNLRAFPHRRACRPGADHREQAGIVGEIGDRVI